MQRPLSSLHTVLTYRAQDRERKGEKNVAFIKHLVQPSPAPQTTRQEEPPANGWRATGGATTCEETILALVQEQKKERSLCTLLPMLGTSSAPGPW